MRPNRGRNTTYANPQRWTPFKPLDGEEALAELLRRYLYSYGPATPQQFARWLSTSAPFIAKLFDSLAGELAEVRVDGKPSWLLATDTAIPAERATGVRLLPYFDAYSVGSYPRELVFPGKAWTRALAGAHA